MVVFDTASQSVLDWERPPGQADPSMRISHETRDIGALWFVPRILAGQRDEQHPVGGGGELRSPLTRIRMALELLPRQGDSARRIADVERDLADLDRLASGP